MSETEMFRLSAQPTISVLHVGTERQPVVIFDSVMRDPTELVNFAAENVAFTPEGVGAGAYPGLGAPAPIAYARPLAQAVEPILRQVFGIGDAPLTKAECRLSLVTTPATQLVPLQRIPHIDTVNEMQFALLHYFCPERFGGTAFFRHRATGYETINAARLAQYRAVREQELGDTPPPFAYPSRDLTTYEWIGDVGARFDRLILYRSHLLHSGIVPNEAALSDDPRRGRLTANIFLTYTPAA